MIKLEFKKVDFFVEEEKPENLGKNPQSKRENQQQTQLTYDNESGNRTCDHSGERPLRHPCLPYISSSCTRSCILFQDLIFNKKAFPRSYRIFQELDKMHNLGFICTLIMSGYDRDPVSLHAVVHAAHLLHAGYDLVGMG
jgi:hypothetical protein